MIKILFIVFLTEAALLCTLKEVHGNKVAPNFTLKQAIQSLENLIERIFNAKANQLDKQRKNFSIKSKFKIQSSNQCQKIKKFSY